VTRSHRLATRLVTPLLAAARGVGLDERELLEAAGIDPGIGGQQGTDGHVTLEQYFRLWEGALAASGARDLPLRAATALGTESLGVIGFACMTSPTVAESFARLARFYGVLSTASRWSLREEASPPHVALVFEIESGPPLATRSAILFALAEIVHFGALLTGRRVPVVQVRLPIAEGEGAEVAGYRAHFAAPLRWGAADAAIVLERSALQIPLLRADASLLAYFEQQAAELAARHAHEEELPLRVRRLVVEALPAGPPSLELIARRVGESPRSLRRHLQAQGTSFQTLLEQTRSDLAKQYLRDPRLTISEIAFLVGFSELSPFQRAFRRWTNLTPRAYRQRALAGAVAAR
jgi:AraC-like DNA-binding protein